MSAAGTKRTAESAELRKAGATMPESKQRRGVAASGEPGPICGKNAEALRKPPSVPLPACPSPPASRATRCAAGVRMGGRGDASPPSLELAPLAGRKVRAKDSPVAGPPAGAGLIACEPPPDASGASKRGAKVLTHPAFDRPAVVNVRRPGRKAGAVSLASVRRQRIAAAATFKPHGMAPAPIAGAPPRDVLAEAAELAPASADARTVHAALKALNATLRKPGALMTDPGAVRAFLALHLAHRQREAFAVLFLDSQHAVIEFDVMFEGTLTQTAVYPREVVRRALALNAGAVILAHNHPSGRPEPSRADEFLTQSLKGALALVDVRVLDHMIVGGMRIVSFSERGML